MTVISVIWKLNFVHTGQFEALQAELVRLREECVQLRGVLANQTRGLKSIASTNYAVADVDMSLINEDGELVLAFEAQKKINRFVSYLKIIVVY